jgi:DNA polymerase-3 subunit delta'
MLFKDVIGQEEVKQHLVDMVLHNRISHALLFLGKEGSGALPLATAFSQYISLLPDKSSSETSGLFAQENNLFNFPLTAEKADEWMIKQPAFSKAEKLIHPDIHFSFPVITKKAGSPPISSDYLNEWREFISQFPYGNIYDWLQFIGAENKQGNITAQECNDIIKKLSLKSFESNYKILILWMPEYLGKEGNKLLKIIEEPPPNTIFILVAENEKAILSTILSRCQLIRVPGLSSIAIETALVQRNKLSSEQAKDIAHICNGNYREALQLGQHANEDYYNLLKDWLNSILKNQTISQVKHIEEISRLGRENQKQFLKYFIYLIEQAVRLQLMQKTEQQAFLEQMSASEKEFVPKLNKVMNLDQLGYITSELDKASYYIERNANAKILFHAVSIKVFHIVKNNLVIQD